MSKLRGMFALAIYDTRTRTLLLARDRFGIKPLFYAPVTERLMFASEISALLELPDIDDRPVRQVISDFAALLYIPAPETFYTGIRALQPGEMLEARLNAHGVSYKIRTYHQWTIAPNPTMTLAQVEDRTAELLMAAVQPQMESDVPLGALLAIGPERLPQWLRNLAGADDTSIIQNLLCWVREEEHRCLCRGMDALPVRRLFEPQ